MATLRLSFRHVRIFCRPNLANGALNGSTGYELVSRRAEGSEHVQVWLMTGPKAGRCWWFGREDVHDSKTAILPTPSPL